MAGVKGKSGRRSRYHEIRIAELCNLSVNWAIDNWDTLEKEDRLRILTTLAPKAIPIQLEHSGPDGEEIQITWRVNGKDYRPTSEPVESVGEPEQV